MNPQCERCEKSLHPEMFTKDARMRVCDGCWTREVLRAANNLSQDTADREVIGRVIDGVNRAEVTDIHIASALGMALDYFGGMREFVDKWMGQIEARITATPGHKDVLNSFEGLAKMMAMYTRASEERGRRAVDNLTTEQLRDELEQRIHNQLGAAKRG